MKRIVLCGVDREGELRTLVQGRRLALLTAASGVTKTGVPTYTRLSELGDLRILLAPEHGLASAMQDGAFSLAVRNNAPIVPIFIGMEDSDVMDPDGFPVQAYTLHILPAIFPDPSLSRVEAKKDMKNRNYEAWAGAYEEFYGKPLIYGES